MRLSRRGLRNLFCRFRLRLIRNRAIRFSLILDIELADEIKLFHAVSLKAGVDAAVLLAARYPRIVPVMSKVVAAAPVLTAVVDDDLDRGQDSVQFALSMMEDEKHSDRGGGGDADYCGGGAAGVEGVMRTSIVADV